LLCVGVPRFGTPVHLSESRFDHREVDVLPVEEDCREKPFVAINVVNFHVHPFALHELLEIGLGFFAERLTREFRALGGLLGVDAKHPDAQLGLVGRDDGEGIAVGHASDCAFFDAQGFRCYW
jgi:hypothetical protein